MKIAVITTGGTIDKIYFDAADQYSVGEPQIDELLRSANVLAEYEIFPLLQKDSNDLTDEDRRLIQSKVLRVDSTKVLITHGTDTMVQTAQQLAGIEGKTIVLVGSLSPARFRESDAVFNIGFAFSSVQLLPPGVYIAMHGRVFDPRRTIKDLQLKQFREVN
jgi:L-asparaginase